LEQNPLPVCIVSNIDRNDILRAIKHHGMNFENVVTSEDAKSYKPQPEIFLMALDKMGVQPSQVLHIGDSLSSDVAGAYNLGIDSFWLNRKRKNVPHNCPATFIGISLTDVIEALK
jgi:2-haloacid dehalogenase/putative hydrolase of the HAD superfamily